MPTLTPGDVVTFPLRGDRFGVALVVHVDDLALNDLYHFAICDAVVTGADAGLDELGQPLPREHDLGEVLAAPVVLEHVGLTRDGVESSDLSVVTTREVDDEMLEGYRAWLQLRYEDAVKRGVMRERIDDNPEMLDEEEGEELMPEEVEGAEEIDDDREMRDGTIDGEVAMEDDPEDDAPTDEGGPSTADAASDEAPVKAATLGMYDVPLGVALIRHRAVFEREAYRDTTLGRFILQIGDDSGEIEEVIGRLLEGDIAAGDELMDFGEPGMRALGGHLRDGLAPETADDILQVLVNSGEEVAYERVGAFMASHGTRPDDPLYGSAVRAYCYAVMLTAGEPESLKSRLSLLDDVRDAELADDVRSAREALAGEG